jgi:hypothetical protein
MKAIETLYNGYRFRSRLEARWAIFFDMMGIEYEYEKEGYNLDGVWYLPDFWLPQYKYWIEIKGEMPTKEEEMRAELLAAHTNNKVYIFFGNVPLPDLQCLEPDKGAHVFYPDGSYDEPHWWCECPICHKIGIVYCACNERLCNCFGETSDHGTNWGSPHLIAAYTAARQARFEHRKR